MPHDSEQDAAAYLGGAMSARRARRFETHLLECEPCWREVTRARLGRSMAEAVRELAPQTLRERVRMATAGAGRSERHRPALQVLGATLGLLALVLAVFLAAVVVPGGSEGRQPEAVVEAIADFHAAKLPAGAASGHDAPDLTGLGFELTGSGGGEVGHIAVDVFGYRGRSGRRVQLYLSAVPFPVAEGAHLSEAPGGPWTASTGGVNLLCAQHPLTLLAISDDAHALGELAGYLGVR